MRRVIAGCASLLMLLACTSDPPAARSDREPLPTETEGTASPEPAETETAEEEGSIGRTVPLQVWLLNAGPDENPQLFLHHVMVPTTQAIGRAAIEQLLRGVPGELRERENVMTVVPDDTQLLGLTIDNGTARVDFNRAFEDTGMGTAADGLQVAQVVYTLTQFPTVKRVEILLEGEPVEVLGGHGITLDGPQTRKDWEASLPPIVVESPFPAETVGRTFQLSGIANVYEATVSWRLTDPDGEPFKKGFITATCGTGCWGTFQGQISLERVPGTSIVLEVFQSSAEDGSPLHLVRIPLEVETG